MDADDNSARQPKITVHYVVLWVVSSPTVINFTLLKLVSKS